MFENEINNINQPYSSNRFVLLDKIEKIVSMNLKEEIREVKQLGEEVLLEVKAKDLASVLKVLKESQELEINSFRNMVPYNIHGEEYLMLSLFSVNDKIPLLIKVLLDDGKEEKPKEENEAEEKDQEENSAERNNMEENTPEEVDSGIYDLDESDIEENTPEKNAPELDSEESLKITYNDIIKIVLQFYKPAEFYLDFNKEAAETYDIAIPSHDPEGLDAFDIYIKCSDDNIEETDFNMSASKMLNNSFYKNSGINELITKMSRFDWNAGIFPELCFCLAFEKVLQLKVPRRAELIRLLLSELFRISSHTYFISAVCNILGIDVAYNLSLLSREKILRIIEMITGSRIHPNYIRIGGVRKNISDEMVRIIVKDLSHYYRDIRKINNILMNDSVILNILKDSGIMNKDLAIEYGVTGPNLRASGIRYDLRKESSLLNYQEFTFSIPQGKVGDCLDRVTIRFEEIYQSLRIISQAVKKLTHGPVIKKINLENLDFNFTAVTSTVECPHGIFKIFMEIEKNNIESLVVFGPSAASLSMGSHILKGNKIENIDLILATLDISCGEILREKNI